MSPTDNSLSSQASVAQPPKRNSPLAIALTCVALALVTLAIYWPVRNFGYVEYDDMFYVTRNSSVKDGLSSQGIAWAFTSFDASNWHPMTWLSLMLDTTLLGDNPAGHHIVNVVLHVLNVLLLLGVLMSMTGALWRSALVAALFAVHPTHVESVAWISERKDVLSGLFWLLAIWAHIRFARHRDWRDYVLTLVFFACGLMAKPMVVTLPCVLLLLDFWPLRRVEFKPSSPSFWRRLAILALEKLPLLAMAIASSIITTRAQNVGVVREGVVPALALRIENAMVSYVRYLENLFWPVNLSPLYPNYAMIGLPTWATWQWSAATAVVILITVLALVAAHKRPYFVVGWLWFLGTLVPVIGLVHVGRQAMADRYAYIPFIGLYLILAWAIGELVARMPKVARGTAIGVVLAAVVALAVTARRQVWMWRDSLTLFEHAIAVTRDNWVMHVNVAWQLANSGDTEGGKRHFEEALRICPECNWERTNYGIMLAYAGEWYAAEQQYRRVIERDRTFVPAYTGLGQMLIERGQPAAGLDILRQAVDIDPTMAESRILLADRLSRQGLRNEAAQQLEEVIRLQPVRAEELKPVIATLRSGQ